VDRRPLDERLREWDASLTQMKPEIDLGVAGLEDVPTASA